MEVDSSCSSSRHYPQEIDQLLEAFGSAFSIEYITSTYLQANHNIDMAGEILCELQASTASIASPQPEDDTDKSARVSTESCNSSVAEGDSKALDLGEGPSLMGCDAGITGKVSMISEFSTKTSPKATQQDFDEFLFKMLGEGFQLDMKVIHEVLSTCGYDMEKSMEALLDKSASTLGKSDDILSKAPEAPSQSYEEMIDLSCQGKSQQKKYVRSSKRKNKGKNDLEKELLQSLFTASQRPEEEPKKSLQFKAINRSVRFGRVVTKPLEDTPIEHKTLYITPLQSSKDGSLCIKNECSLNKALKTSKEIFLLDLFSHGDGDEDNFHVLRQAVKEHWATMKEYYKAAGEAFLQGDHARAKRLMEQGIFFSKKARELDEMSLQKIVETREEEEEVLFDFSDLEPKESVQHLRSQLAILCGIQSIPHIKVKLGNGEGGAKEVSRKRLTLKLLEKESIKWTEMGTANMILIQVGEIKPGSLSFSKK